MEPSTRQVAISPWESVTLKVGADFSPSVTLEARSAHITYRTPAPTSGSDDTVRADPGVDARDPRWSTQRAVGSAAFLTRYFPHEEDEESSPCLRKFKHLEAERCPVPFRTVATPGQATAHPGHSLLLLPR